MYLFVKRRKYLANPNPKGLVFRNLMKIKFGILLSFFILNCFFAVDWSSDESGKVRGKASVDDFPEAENANLSKQELSKRGKKGEFKTREEQELFDMMISAGSDQNTARNCAAKYGNCKSQCWTQYPIPKVETVFTAVTVDRKREDCIARCGNLCDDYTPSSSRGSMPNSGKGNYSDPNAPRY